MSPHSHACVCHRKSSVAYTGSLLVGGHHRPNAVYIRDHFGLENIINLMLYTCIYASWTFPHVPLQQPDLTNYPEVVALQKTIVSEKKSFFLFFFL